MNNMAVIISQNLLRMAFMLALVLGLSSYPTEARRREASNKFSIDNFGTLPSGPSYHTLDNPLHPVPPKIDHFGTLPSRPSYHTLDNPPHGPSFHTPDNPPHPVPSKTDNFGTLPSEPSYHILVNPPHGPSYHTPDNPPSSCAIEE
nr:hypothetical protein CFP56_72171 [Quercus suber]